jgi:hypothetical protein
MNSASGVVAMRRFFRGLAMVFSCALALTTSAQADSSDAETGAAPWQISNGASEPVLHVPRDIERAYASGTRSRDGKPGQNYWQNHAAHSIRIAISPPDRRVHGEQEIVYTNNSPTPMPMLIFRLYMNAHNAGAMRDKAIGPEFLTGGVTVEQFSIDGKPVSWDDPNSGFGNVNGPGSTVHGIMLANPIPPKGKVRIAMKWHYELASDGGWKEGAIDDSSYFLAYFFPRVTNYSDFGGWDYSPFTLGREFNNDFADFDVTVSAPRDHLVWATGELQNPDEVLQPGIAKRLKASRSSDRVVTLAEGDDVKGGKVTARDATLAWKWRATNVPDFAIAVSDHYRWQASSVMVDPVTKRRIGIEAAYPESATDFQPMVETARQAMTFASTKYPGVAYPYPKTTIVLGNADEEYPMMVNDGSNLGTREATQYPENAFTAFVATHEILHSWFPFYMGINDRRFPFMDEGWTTAFEYLRNREVIGPEIADALFIDMRVKRVGWADPVSGNELPIVTPHDSLFGQSPVFSFNQYGKAALGYLALRDLMGDAAFKSALHEFMARWNGKRPLPWDMFNTFNDVGPANYNWFFNNWFFGYNYMDLSLGAVSRNGAGHQVTVRNTGGMAMPFDLVATYTDGTSEHIHRTPAVWQTSPRVVSLSLPATKSLRSLSLDTGIFVDFNPADNGWTATTGASGH